jgi:hypothetical protein
MFSIYTQGLKGVKSFINVKIYKFFKIATMCKKEF